MKKKTSVVILNDQSVKNNNMTYRISQGVSTLLLTVGILLAFSGLYQDLHILPLLIGVCVFYSVLYELARWKDKYENGLFVMGVLGLLGGLVMFPLGIYKGCLYMINQIFTAWNQNFDSYQTLYSLESCTSGQRIAFWVLLVIFLAAVTCKLASVRALFLESFWALGLLFFTILLGINKALLPVLFILIGWLGFWFQDTLLKQHIGKLVCVGIGVGLLGGWLVSFGGLHGTSSRVSGFRKEVENAYEEFRYGKDTLPKGDLVKASELIGDEGEKTLKLTMDEPQEMYLKGFIGSAYTGTRWEEESKAMYRSGDYSGILDWLAGRDFAAQHQYGAYEKLVNFDVVTQQVQVKNTGAYRKYVYAPYELLSFVQGNAKEVLDWQMQSGALFGSSHYELRSVVSDVPAELQVAQDLSGGNKNSKNYADSEKVYRNFVYDTYLDVNEEDQALLEDLVYNQEDWSKSNVNQLTSKIRIALQSLASYTDTPERYTGQKDFLSWFLETTKKGNAAYFATAAVLAYRTAGVPARYVEGYHLSSSEVGKMQEKEETVIDLSQKDAHAWAEIYMDGMGWMPVEVVPGFYYAEYTTQKILDLPQTSINIQDETQNDELQGNTTDQLEKSKSETKKTEEPPVKKVLHILGILLLILIAALALQVLLLLQYMLRWHRKLHKAYDGRWYYDQMQKLLKAAKIPGRGDYPYERIDEIVKRYPAIAKEDCEHFIALMQKSIFAEEELKIYEKKTVQAFSKRLSQEIYQDASRFLKWKLKYLYCLYGE